MRFFPRQRIPASRTDFIPAKLSEQKLYYRLSENKIHVIVYKEEDEARY